MTVRKNASVSVKGSEPDAIAKERLPEELQTRLLRMAAKQGKQPQRLLLEIVQAEWVRFACRERLDPREW